jgi:hypothetical protein
MALCIKLSPFLHPAVDARTANGAAVPSNSMIRHQPKNGHNRNFVMQGMRLRHGSRNPAPERADAMKTGVWREKHSRAGSAQNSRGMT